MVHLQGERPYSQSAAAVYPKLADAAFLLSCIGGVEEVLEASADRVRWKLRPGFSFLRATLETTMEVVERQPDQFVRVKLFSKGIGASTTVEASVSLRSTEAGCVLSWAADVTELTGLLKLVPKTLIQSSAQKVIDDTWAQFDLKVVAP